MSGYGIQDNDLSCKENSYNEETPYTDQKHKEVLMIIQTKAVVYIWAMMVKVFNTFLAEVAMECSSTLD